MFDRLVRFSARMTPLAIAVSNGAEHISYRDFDRAIDQAAAALDRAGVAGPALVGISVRDSYRHLLLIIACARRGVPTVSLIPEMAGPMVMLAGAAKLLSDDPAHAPALLVDGPWLAAALAAAPVELAPVAVDAQALGRVQLSSGSTGEPKAVGMSWTLMERRIEHTWTRNLSYERLLWQVWPILLAVLVVRTLAWRRLPGRIETRTVIAPPLPEAEAAFRQRLSAKRRGARLIAIEAHDHYLKVHTDAGEELITLRFADALQELARAHGWRVHRSWWVAADAVEGVRWRRGAGEVRLVGGLMTPVSRTYAPTLKEAGWF